MVSWRIIQLEYNVNDGGVLVVHWRATTDQVMVDSGPYAETTYSVCDLTYDSSSESFIPFDSLTEEIVLAWVWDEDVGNVDKDLVEQELQEKLSEKVSPIIETGLPWSSQDAESTDT